MTRYATITVPSATATDATATVDHYLPHNYRVVGVLDPHAKTDPKFLATYNVLIAGEDNAGWTLDEYILPRLASGLYHGHEVALSEVAR